jgi:hypothetical protein
MMTLIMMITALNMTIIVMAVVLTCELPVPANMAHVPIEFLFHLIKQEE